jgi:hypothetical protein
VTTGAPPGVVRDIRTFLDLAIGVLAGLQVLEVVPAMRQGASRLGSINILLVPTFPPVLREGSADAREFSRRSFQ